MASKPEVQVNIHEAKTHLSRYVARAAAGETLIIAKSGKPIAKLSPMGPDISDSRWFFGATRGKWVFDEKVSKALDDVIADSFLDE
jgi:prevent-host-death family protein